MVDATAIEEELQKHLPAEQYDEAASLAQVLADALDGKLVPGARVKMRPGLRNSVKLLANKTIKLPQATVSFGEASQNGDVTIGSVVGGNQITVTIHISTPSVWPPAWLLLVALGALTVAGALALWRNGLTADGGSAGAPTAAGTSAPAPTRAPSAPAPPATLTIARPTPSVQPTPGPEAFVERCIAEQHPDVSAARIFLVEAGANIDILGLEDRRDQPVVLALTGNGQPLALVVLDMHQQSQAYSARAVLDAGCQPLADNRFGNEEPSRLHVLQEWENLLICLDTGSYRIRVGALNHTPVQMITRAEVAGTGCPA